MTSNVISTYIEKLKRIDGDMKAKASVIKVETKRKLTSGEVAMSRLVFKDAVDYSKVWIHIGGIIHTRTGNSE